MIISRNLEAIDILRNMKEKNKDTIKSIEKLSSGLNINRASNNAAGLAISEKMRNQIRGLEQGSRNSQDGISLIQTAEGTLEEVHTMLQRGKQLVVQSANGIYTDNERHLIQKEIDELTEEINRVIENAEFNGIKLFNNKTENVKDGDIGDVSGNVPHSFNKEFNINSGSVNITADGVYKITGSSITSNTIKINSGVTATVVIEDVNIDTSSLSNVASFQAAGSNVNLILVGNNSFKSGEYCAGINVTSGSSLTIQGNGRLNAEGGNLGAGIGGNKNECAGDITINSGIINATGGKNLQSQVSGSSFQQMGGGAGIGSGASSDPDMMAGNIIIKGGTIKAIAQIDAAGIGGSGKCNGGNIQIDGATVEAIGHNSSAIGKGAYGNSHKTIMIDGVIYASVGGKVDISPSSTGSTGSTIINNKGGIQIQVGNKAGQSIDIIIDKLSIDILDIDKINLSSMKGAVDALSKYESAICKVSEVRATLGSYQNRLEHAILSLDNSGENLQATESRIRDTDIAKEMMEYMKNNILTQAQQSMIMQANQSPDRVLQLLK